VTSYISARFAIRIQYIVMAVIGLSLLAVFLTPSQPQPLAAVDLIGDFESTSFWQVFAIFFPAVTGIMAGANMSGELKNPRRAIPLGALSAIGLTLVIYTALAVFLAIYVPEDQLLDTGRIVMAHMAFWPPAVTLGIMAATFSSALGSMVGAPRVLQALAEQKTVPLSGFFAARSKNGEPRNAIIVTALAVEAAIGLGNLDVLATLITMFFLITYGFLNLVVFIQQSMSIISFRPTFRIPRLVSLAGAVGCLIVMFLISPAFSIVAIITTGALYALFERKGLRSTWGDIRGGMFLALAEQASRIAARFPRHQISWKPDLLIPIDNPKVWAGPLLFIRNVTYPSGSIFAFTVQDGDVEKLREGLDLLVQPLRDQGVLVSSAVIDDQSFLRGARNVIQTLKGGAFRPNTLFLTLGKESRNDEKILQLASYASDNEMGSVILCQHPRVAFGMQKTVNLWLRDRSPNWHLATLLALQLQANWDGLLNVITVAPKRGEVRRLRRFMERLSNVARFPLDTKLHVLVGRFGETFEDAPSADINIFGLAPKIDCRSLRKRLKAFRSSCLYVRDSGMESALV